MAGWRRVEVRDTGSATSGPAGVSISGYNSGDITTVQATVQVDVHGREPVPWPHQVGVLPREAAVFQKRDEAQQLRAAVSGGGTAVLCQVLRGTGGVGKTQLAAHYARQAWKAGELDVLVWADASSRSALISAYAQASEELLAAQPGDPERSAQAFLRWLEPRPPGHEPACRWLVVLDDVADPGDVRGLWPPNNPHGRTVVTTRRRDVAVPGQRIDLGMFTPEEAAAYLSAFLAEYGRHDDRGQIDALARDLGYLPLALSQAAAYITDVGIPIDCPACTHEQCPSYRHRLANRTTTLASLLPEPATLPDDQTTTVAAAWSLSIERADALRPAGLARPALQLAAVLDPNGIPQDVMNCRPARDYLTQHRTHTIPEHDPHGDVTEQDAWDALRVLHRLNLITHDPDTPRLAVRTHQLVQRATRDTLTPDQHDQTARAAADALIHAWPDIERDTTLAQALRANTNALTSHAEQALYDSDGAHEVLFRAGRSLAEAGQVAAAANYFAYLVKATAHHLGLDHRSTLDARRHAARWQGEAGDAAGAAAAFDQLQQDTLRLLGADHSDTVTTRAHLARWLGETGDAVAAAAECERLLPDALRVLGADHPDTLTLRANLGRWRGTAGDAAGAAAAFADLLADRRRVLGPDHPHTLSAWARQIRWTAEAGDLVAAISASAQLLPEALRVLGPDHPETLSIRANIARFHARTGNTTEAAAALTELLADRRRVLGPDHQHTLRVGRDLALLRARAGDAAEAVVDFQHVLADQERVLGPDHPDTLDTLADMAEWQAQAGNVQGAVATYTDLSDRLLRLRGAESASTLWARERLAHWREAGGSADHQPTEQ
ncbi:tetratricopeptide repeat protein [Streptomyces sp. NPDC051315]|uniref:tetratricopeptide repeat protein n=1 Tax=Streptomyces sp. NPDC051315 TaxID=3365650 RepID=UPI0037B2BE39